MKIAFHTAAIGRHVSGGINYLVNIGNRLYQRGYDFCIFVDENDLSSRWLNALFPIYHSSDKRYKEFSGILISPFSPTAQAVNDHPNAQRKILNVHSHECEFVHNGSEWCEMARRSYSLPNLELLCVSNYLHILMRQIYKRNPLSDIVQPGIDVGIFYPLSRSYSQKLRVGVFQRTEYVRGYDTAITGIKMAREHSDFETLVMGPTSNPIELADFFRSIDVFVDASRLAGSPVMPKEAMACGAIPIATNLGAPDYILDGFTGIIVSPESPEQISRGIMNLSKLGYQERKRMAELASEYVSVRYDWDQVTKNFLKVIECQN